MGSKATGGPGADPSGYRRDWTIDRLPDPALAEVPDVPLGIYLHVPFCIRRCGYCAFVTYAEGEVGDPDAHARWSRAVGPGGGPGRPGAGPGPATAHQRVRGRRHPRPCWTRRCWRRSWRRSGTGSTRAADLEVTDRGQPRRSPARPAAGPPRPRCHPDVVRACRAPRRGSWSCWTGPTTPSGHRPRSPRPGPPASATSAWTSSTAPPANGRRTGNAPSTPRWRATWTTSARTPSAWRTEPSWRPGSVGASSRPPAATRPRSATT